MRRRSVRVSLDFNGLLFLGQVSVHSYSTSRILKIIRECLLIEFSGQLLKLV